MALSDYINPAIAAYDYYQTMENMGDAEKAIDSGYDTGRTDIKAYADPYVESGTKALAGLEALGEFEYDFEDYLDSDFVRWMKEDQDRRLKRQYAASPTSYYSGSSLMGMERDMTNFLGTLYDMDHENQLGAYNANVERYKVPATLGADVAKSASGDLASLAVGHGQDMAAVHGNYADITSAALSDLQNIISGGGSGGGGGDGGSGEGDGGSGGGGSNPYGPDNPTNPNYTGILSTGNDVLDALLSSADFDSSQIAHILNNPEVYEDMAEQLNMPDGAFGEGSWYEGLEQLKDITAWDIDQFRWINNNRDLLEAEAIKQNLPDGAFGEGSWYEGLDQIDFGELSDDDLQGLLNDNNFWDDLGNWASNLWDKTGGAFADWVSDVFL